MNSVPSLASPTSGETPIGYQPTQPASTLQAEAASRRNTPGKTPMKSQRNKRPTHFVCFPLVSEESVSQLSKSLAYFRSVTTPLPSAGRDAIPEAGVGREANPKPTAPEQSSNNWRGRDVDQAVRVIPEVAHRPPGTFHLTLGVMYLPETEDLEKAVALLQKIDFLELLKRAESDEEDEAHKLRRERRRNKGSKNGLSGDANYVAVRMEEMQSERQSEPGSLSAGEHQTSSTEQGKAESPSATKERANQTTETRKDTRSLPSVGEEQADAEKRQLTKDPQQITATSSHGPEERGEIQDVAEEVGGVLSSPLQSLKSLTREISPPPVSAPLTLNQDDSRDPDPPQLISISLSSLGTFPSSRSARVFFAHPHDPTSRLHRFGNLVRDVFREAGLITETRPLVLHATVANLIYVKGRTGKGKGRGGKGGKRNGKAGDDVNVDAREILRLFNHGPDAIAKQRGEASSLLSSSPTPPSAHAKVNEPNHDEGGEPAAPALTPEKKLADCLGVEDRVPDLDVPPSPASNATDQTAPLIAQRPQIPFVWAEDISISSIRICKMGAEPSTIPGWGLEYRPVAEKVFMPPQPQTQTSGEGGEEPA